MRTLIAVGLAVAALAVVAGCGGDAGGGESGEQPPFSTAEWSTDFGEHSVALEEFTGGGPPKDGIPAIDSRRFVSADQADDFLAPREPVAVLELRGAARAYPLQILLSLGGPSWSKNGSERTTSLAATGRSSPKQQRRLHAAA